MLAPTIISNLPNKARRTHMRFRWAIKVSVARLQKNPDAERSSAQSRFGSDLNPCFLHRTQSLATLAASRGGKNLIWMKIAALLAKYCDDVNYLFDYDVKSTIFCRSLSGVKGLAQVC